MLSHIHTIIEIVYLYCQEECNYWFDLMKNFCRKFFFFWNCPISFLKPDKFKKWFEKTMNIFLGFTRYSVYVIIWKVHYSCRNGIAGKYSIKKWGEFRINNIAISLLVICWKNINFITDYHIPSCIEKGHYHFGENMYSLRNPPDLLNVFFNSL